MWWAIWLGVAIPAWLIWWRFDKKKRAENPLKFFGLIQLDPGVYKYKWFVFQDSDDPEIPRTKIRGGESDVFLFAKLRMRLVVHSCERGNNPAQRQYVYKSPTVTQRKPSRRMRSKLEKIAKEMET